MHSYSMFAYGEVHNKLITFANTQNIDQSYHVFHTNRDFSIAVEGPVESNDVGGVAIM